MKNAIILHGISESKQEFCAHENSASNSHWIPWLKWELIKNDILCQTPEMPKPYLPDMNYSEWASVFSQFNLDKYTILVGHSCGGGFLLKYLSINKDIKFNRLILVAPWLDLERVHPSFFSDFELDSDLVNRCNQIDLFYSTDDSDYILSSVNKIICTFDNINIHKFSDKGHFCKDDLNSNEFPEILECVLK